MTVEELLLKLESSIGLLKLESSIGQASAEDSTALEAILEELRAIGAAWERPGVLEEELEEAIQLARGLAASSSAAPGSDLEKLSSFVAAALAVLTGSTGEGDPLEDEVDDELLRLFLTGCEEAITKVEGCLIELEENPGNEEALEEVRGVIHTLKGECGVIPLPEAQHMFHETESMIHRRTTQGQALPVDVLLGAIDWFKGYADELNISPGAAAPPVQHILDQLQGLEPELAAQGAQENAREAAPEAASQASPEEEPLPQDSPTAGEASESTPAAEEPVTDEPVAEATATVEAATVEPAAEVPAAAVSEAESTPGASSEATSEPEVAAEGAPAPDARVSFSDEVLADPTLPDFVGEARGHLEDAEAALLEVEQSPDDLELINRIFRTFHTIKGVAGFMNMEAMVELAHSTEYLLDEFRKDNLVCTEQHTTLIFACCDTMGQMLEYLLGGEAPLQAEVQHLVDQTTLAAKNEPFQPGALGAGGPQQAPSVPQRDDSEAAAGEVAPSGEATAEQQPTSSPEGGQPPAAESGDAVAAQAESAAATPAAAPESVPATASRDGVPAPEATLPRKKKPAKKKYRLDNTVKVATERLDVLVDMVGELVIAQQMVSQDPALESVDSQRLSRNLSQVAKITRDLQESAMSLRMVTLKSTFQKMARLARDVAQKAGKSVNLQVTGEDIELDRTVVEEISDPLVHLLRNSIDHGLEDPDERREAGKAERGVVSLNAYHQGGSIVIEIADDGRGLNRDKILAKAVERGLLPADASLDEIPDGDVFKLIFQAGFSTADQVTDISGRGVGMDVVRRNIEKMRGKIDISSVPGKGTSFYLRLPLTLAIIDGMVVRVGSRRYVIPTLAIEMSFRPSEEQLHSLMHEGQLVNVRGMLLPVHRLRQVFHLDEGAQDYQDGILILLEDNGQRVCLLVDEIIGQQQVVIKNLGKALPPTPCVSGGAILGDGKVALIVDIDAILGEVHGQPSPAA